MPVDLKQIQLRRDTTANWAAANPVLLAGEIGIDLTLIKWKLGDGATAWNALAYQAVAPTGTGVPHIVGGVQNAAASLIVAADITNATITDVQVAAANKDGAAGTASMRTLGAGATQALAGNGTAAKATILATARTIGGKSFDGSANIVPAGLVIQVFAYNEAADKSTTSSTYSDLLSQTVTISAGSTLIVDWRGAYTSTLAGENLTIKLTVDGTDIYEASGTYSDLNDRGFVTLFAAVTGLGSGARIVKVQYKANNNVSAESFNCSSTPTKNYSRLLVQEISG